jgi:N-acetyl-anhydromuramyl-L-alanine amidase AmpD
MEYIGYHYVIKPDGQITNTRDDSCVAGADKWSKNNYRFIQIAFVGDDKPTRKQEEAMARLAKDIQIRYKLPIDTVSAHSDW